MAPPKGPNAGICPVPIGVNVPSEAVGASGPIGVKGPAVLTPAVWRQPVSERAISNNVAIEKRMSKHLDAKRECGLGFVVPNSVVL